MKGTILLNAVKEIRNKRMTDTKERHEDRHH